MKIKIWSLFSLLLILALSFTLASCGDDEQGSGENLTDITTQGMISVNGVDTIIVKNAVTTYDLAKDFIPKISLNPGVESLFSGSEDFSSKLGTTITLKEGDNFIYLKVTDDNGNTNTRTFNIYRNKMLTVTFDPDGGTMDGSTDKKQIKVEEGTIMSSISALRAGYKFVKWDYDFKNPIKENITIKALWVPNTYKITAVVDGEKTECSVEFGAVPKQLQTPDKVGYKFIGWKVGDSDFDAKAAYTFDRDIEVTACFEIISYNIQYILGYDGATNSEKNPTSFDITVDKVELLAPTFGAGYTFDGWYTDANFSESSKITHITASNVGKDLVIYAKWKGVSNVTFDPNGGECDKSTASFYYGEIYALPTPTKDGYVFAGWYNGEKLISNTGVWTITGNITVVAEWATRQNNIEYVLNFDKAVNNPSNPSSYDASKDGVITLLPPTLDAKHKFDGWYTEANFTEGSKITELTSENVTGEIILYAKWLTVSTVTFVTDCEQTVESKDISFGEAYELPVVTKENFTFAGWFDENNNQVESTGNWKYSADVVLTAKWNETEYTISFVANGGEISGEYQNKYSISTDFTNFKVPNATKKYATFDGWFFDEAFEKPFAATDLVLYKGATLYAKWNAIKVTVNYDVNGGSVTTEKDEFNLGETYVFLTPENPGQTFGGWYMGDELMGSQITWTDETVLEINLVAKWEELKYTITYDLSGGTAEGLVEEYTVKSPDFKLPVPTKTGFHFVGWKIDDAIVGRDVTIYQGSTGHRSYKAIWAGDKDEETGLLFSLVGDKMVVVGIDREINNAANVKDPIVNGIKIPAYFNDVEVVGIDSYAFKAFGEMFSQTRYANMSSSYVTISVPTTVKKIGKDAFANCNGLKIVLYDESSSRADYELWDSMVVWESGNRSARDCIWGLRPAIGWTRYSRVPIPEGYDEKVPN